MLKDQEIHTLADTMARLAVNNPQESDVIFGTAKGIDAKMLDVIIDGASTPIKVVRVCNKNLDLVRVYFCALFTFSNLVRSRGPEPPLDFVIDGDGTDKSSNSKKSIKRNWLQRDLEKGLYFLVVCVAHIIAFHLIGEGSIVRTTVIFFYLSNEGISILENAAPSGLPVSEKLKEILA